MRLCQILGSFTGVRRGCDFGKLKGLIKFEDGYDPVVYYLDGDVLIERMPVPWNEDGNSSPDGPNDGRDVVASPIAEDVTRLRFEKADSAGNGDPLIIIELELTGQTGAIVSLDARVRLGGAL